MTHDRHGEIIPDGHAGAIVDQRQTLADEAVEQGRLAHIGAADDGDLQSHVGLLTQFATKRQRMQIS